jgi:hypothetical protein
MPLIMARNAAMIAIFVTCGISRPLQIILGIKFGGTIDHNGRIGQGVNRQPFNLTTNLGVRSSNLFGRASKLLILCRNLCAIFSLLTLSLPGLHRGNTPMGFRMARDDRLRALLPAMDSEYRLFNGALIVAMLGWVYALGWVAFKLLEFV